MCCTTVKIGLPRSEVSCPQGPVPQKSRNFSGLFRMQFPLYLRNAECSKPSNFSKQSDFSLTTGYSGPKSPLGFRETDPSLLVLSYSRWGALTGRILGLGCWPICKPAISAPMFRLPTSVCSTKVLQRPGDEGKYTKSAPSNRML